MTYDEPTLFATDNFRTVESPPLFRRSGETMKVEVRAWWNPRSGLATVSSEIRLDDGPLCWWTGGARFEDVTPHRLRWKIEEYADLAWPTVTELAEPF